MMECQNVEFAEMMQPNNRIQVLDAFRGLAVISVVLFHYTSSFGPRQSWFGYGSLGVEFFFIISGFVILMTLERSIDPLDFASRRFSRIYPAFFVCVTIASLFSLAVGQDLSLKQYVANLTLTAPFLSEHWIDKVYWSLLVEIKFYVCVATIYFSIRKHFVYAWCIFSALSTQLHHFSSTISSLIPAAMFCYFSMGMGFYLVFKQKRLGAESVILFALSSVFYIAYQGGETLSFHLIISGFVVLFSLFLLGKLDWLPQTGLSAIGLISYSVYLIHRNIGTWFIEKNLFPWQVSVPIAIIATIFFSFMLYCMVEIPGQKSLRRLHLIRK